jgi:hypothetical protein
MLMAANKPLPKQKEGKTRRTHSNTIETVIRVSLRLPGSSPIKRSINVTSGPAIPMRKLKTMTNKLHMLGDLKRKETQYVNPAVAGPKRSNKTMTPPTTSLSVVVNVSIPKASIKMMVIQQDI